MSAPLPDLDTRPMEAQPVDELPSGEGWQYEPKYDGFRCLAFRHEGKVDLQSKKQKPLQRYFPEVAQGLAELAEENFVLDGELVIPKQSFETLQLRLHPAASRVRKLAAEHPAQLIAFDILARHRTSLLDRPLSERREVLQDFTTRHKKSPVLALGRAVKTLATAKKWLGTEGLDGIVAKPVDLRYEPGKRAMKKFKLWTTVDCVVGGVYLQGDGPAIDSLLLGLYDADGLLHYVGRSRLRSGAKEIGELLEQLAGGSGFTGRSPSAEHRWSQGRRAYKPLEPVVVVEVTADHITNGFMRHGARLLRVRHDKRAEDCLMDQIQR